MRLIAMPKCPYRPDRPMRCKYVSECLGKSKLMTTFTAWISMPRVNKSNTQKQHTENHLTKHINKKTKQLIWACTIRALCWNDSSIRTLRESPLIQRWFSMGFPRPKNTQIHNLSALNRWQLCTDSPQLMETANRPLVESHCPLSMLVGDLTHNESIILHRS